MTVSAGTRLGPYEILSPLGAGGMGEVWRARDTRLAREVAIKVLPTELSADPERLRRFEKEARAASALSYPNIVTIYEVGREESVSFIAMELVEGKTLRGLLAESAFPLRRLLPVAAQIAEGLTRAHEAGIVHRDLKPENVMVTRDGLVKILDFGLAKLTNPEQDSGQSASALTVSAGTRPGIAMGTAAYMSPEQASGHPVDFRSDQFSLGSMLYEMVTGRPAFRRATMAQTMAAIIDEEPEPILAAAPRTPAPLRWVIERCLVKEPEHRYAATRDLVRDLTNLRDHLSELSSGAGIGVEAPRRRPRWRTLGLASAMVAALIGMLFLGRRLERASVSEPRYRQLTFRGAGIGTARFAPDGQTVVFSSQTEGRPPELFSMRLDSPEPRALGLPPAQILSISSSGQMAILLLRPFALAPRVGHLLEQAIARDASLLNGTLAEAPLVGGAPRELLEDVSFADWERGSADLAVVHRSGNANRIEFPIGKIVDGAEIEIFNHLRTGPRFARKDLGWIVLRRGEQAVPSELSVTDGSALEIFWASAPAEVWWNSIEGAGTMIHARDLSGRDRIVTTLPGDFVLYDRSLDGRVLMGRHMESLEILGSFPGEASVRNLSYFSASEALALSAAGDTLLFSDVSPVTQEGGGFTYIRTTDGSPPKQVAGFSGWTSALSPDGKWILAGDGAFEDRRPVLVPTGPGQSRSVDTRDVRLVFIEERRQGFFPDGKRIYFSGYQAGHTRRTWMLDLGGGAPRAITPEGTSRPVLVGDGRFVCARGTDFDWRLYPTDARGEPARVNGLLAGEEPFQSTPDGRWLYVRGADELKPGESVMTTRIYRLDPLTGQRELWKEIPARGSGAGGAILGVLFSADGKTCVWTHVRYTTELILAEGLK